MCQSHTGRLTGLWFLPKPAFGLNTNDDDDIYIYSNRYGSRTLTLFIITYLITKGPVPFYQQASATIHTTTNNSGMSCLRNIFAGKKKAGDCGLHVCQIRTRAVLYLREILKKEMYLNNASTGDD